MIANCPSCGTHYKHEPPKAPVAMRCGRCDTSLDLNRFRPYLIVQAGRSMNETLRPMTYVPVGLDHPNLEVYVAAGAARPTSTPLVEVVPPPPVMEAPFPTVETIMAGGQQASAETTPAKRGFGLVVSTVVVAGAGAAVGWQWGGAPTIGLAVGGAVGAVAWWGWRQWASRR